MGSRPLPATRPETCSPRLPGSKGAGKSQTFCQSGGPTGNLESGTSHREAGAVENSFLQRWRQSQQWPLVSGGGNVNLNAWVGGGLSAVNGGDRGLLGNLSHALTLTVPVCRVLFGSPCIDSVCYPVSLQLCVCVCVCVCLCVCVCVG